MLKFFAGLDDVEREVADANSQAKLDARRQRSRPVTEALHQWMNQQRQKIPDGSATARAGLHGESTSVSRVDN